ncbi:MAG: hypothetical protein F6K16_34835 [Symploca sp. SIO2B6]|nr:hypothetical protein [Symploca sp. SIO2B6]
MFFSVFLIHLDMVLKNEDNYDANAQGIGANVQEIEGHPPRCERYPQENV